MTTQEKDALAVYVRRFFEFPIKSLDMNVDGARRGIRFVMFIQIIMLILWIIQVIR